jgi:hypothetical protein
MSLAISSLSRVGNVSPSSSVLVVPLQLTVALQSGVPGPTPWSVPVPWAQGLNCVLGPPATSVIFEGSIYVCTTAHVAGVSFDPTKWTAILNFATAIVSWLASLPVVRPATAGQPWNNGGVLSIS